jgi:3-hydroxyisobutyrate dehydrogenase
VQTKLSDVTASADMIFTVVKDDNTQRAVFASSGDSLLLNAQGMTFVNCETIRPVVHVEIEHAAHQAGAEEIEARMASSIPQARSGTLFLMCG